MSNLGVLFMLIASYLTIVVSTDNQSQLLETPHA